MVTLAGPLEDKGSSALGRRQAFHYGSRIAGAGSGKLWYCKNFPQLVRVPPTQESLRALSKAGNAGGICSRPWGKVVPSAAAPDPAGGNKPLIADFAVQADLWHAVHKSLVGTFGFGFPGRLWDAPARRSVVHQTSAHSARSTLSDQMMGGVAIARGGLLQPPIGFVQAVKLLRKHPV